MSWDFDWSALIEAIEKLSSWLIQSLIPAIAEIFKDPPI